MDASLRDLVVEAVTHVAARGMIVELEPPLLGLIKSLAIPIHMSQTALTYQRYPPRLGEHTEEILHELGYDASEIETFKTQGIV